MLGDQERRGIERNSRLLGTVREVLSEGPSKRNPDRLSARDSGNRIVVWPKDDDFINDGSKVNLKITDAHAQILIAERI